MLERWSALLLVAVAACVPEGNTGPLTHESGQDAEPQDTLVILDTGVEDAGTRDVALDSGHDAGLLDSGPADAIANPPDLGFADAGTPDSGFHQDAAAPDSGLLLVPGSHVQVPNAQINIMQDTYNDVVTKLGPGSRTAVANTRSYEWVAGGGTVTVWFANTNLDSDDAPPNNVDGTDRVLWIAVNGGYSGRTPAGIGLGANRVQVEAAYGVAGNAVTIDNPAGTLAQYFETGMLVAFNTSNTVRTLTITRAYSQAPDGSIDLEDARLSFARGDLQGYTFVAGFPVAHSNRGDVRSVLGEPDAEGPVVMSGQNLYLMTYAFIGLEVFSRDTSNDIVFFTIHAPYYGSDLGMGIGSPRPQFDSHLSNLGYSSGSASSGNPDFYCYLHLASVDIGVSYTDTSPIEVTSLVTPLLQCP